MYHVELRGSPNGLEWPAICANCGNPAAERITVRKAFASDAGYSRWRRSSSFFRYKVYSVRVPLCATCAREHRATVKVPTLAGAVTAVLFHPTIVAVIGCAWLLKEALSGVRWTSLGDAESRHVLTFAAVPALGIAWCLGLAWNLTRPQRIAPQTEVALACDFGRDVSEFYEQERHIYTLRNKDFADALARANQRRVWTPDDRARSGKLQLTVNSVVVIGLIIAAIIWLR